MRIPELEKQIRDAEEKLRQLRIAKQALSRIGGKPTVSAREVSAPLREPSERPAPLPKHMNPKSAPAAALSLLSDGKPRTVAEVRAALPSNFSRLAVTQGLWWLKGKGRLVKSGVKYSLPQKGKPAPAKRQADGRMPPGTLTNGILDLLRDGGERGATEIAALVGTTPDSVSKSLQRLRARGELNNLNGKWFAVARALTTNGAAAHAD